MCHGSYKIVTIRHSRIDTAAPADSILITSKKKILGVDARIGILIKNGVIK